MTYLVAAGQFLSYAFTGSYVIGAGWMLAAWLFTYREPDKSWKQLLAVLIWPLPVLAALVRWSFTGKRWDEP